MGFSSRVKQVQTNHPEENSVELGFLCCCFFTTLCFSSILTGREKSRIRETLSLSTCADNSILSHTKKIYIGVRFGTLPYLLDWLCLGAESVKRNCHISRLLIAPPAAESCNLWRPQLWSSTSPSSKDYDEVQTYGHPVVSRNIEYTCRPTQKCFFSSFFSVHLNRSVVPWPLPAYRRRPW